MKPILICILLTGVIQAYSQTIQYSDTTRLQTDFKAQVQEGMSKHHKRYLPSSFYEFNVVKSPLAQTEDSIVYDVRFITTEVGRKLWSSKAVFTKSGNNLVITIGEFVLFKNSSTSGIDNINTPAEKLDRTKYNIANLKGLEKEVYKFFKGF